MKIKIFSLLMFLMFKTMIVHGQSKDSIEVTKATEKFITAFINFDWPVFRNSFSSNATMFFPTGDYGKRRDGQKEIEATWLEMFPEFIDSTKKFDLKIDPKNIIMQLYGSVAIVSFHLFPNENVLSRRTIVFAKEMGEWKIVHLHASTLTKSK